MERNIVKIINNDIINNVIIAHMYVMGEGKTVIWQLFLSLLYG
jgi:hypothetical protein